MLEEDHRLRRYRRDLRVFLESQRERINDFIAADPLLADQYAGFEPPEISQTVRDLESRYFVAYTNQAPADRDTFLRTIAVENVNSEYDLPPHIRKLFKLLG